MPATAAAAFDRQRVRQARERLIAGSAWHDEDWVFASVIGPPLDPRNVTHRFDRIRRGARMPWLRLHDLRHACATFLIAEDVDLRVVTEVLGHSTYRMTMDTYGHVLPRQLDDASAAIDRALRR